jgi:hypothetical protein
MRPQPRLALAIASASVTAAATATATAIDTVSASGGRARHMTLDLVLTTANVVSNKPTVLKLQHSDITDATGYSDISGFVGGTDFTIPNADTTNPNLYKFNVNLQGKKRYIKVLVSPATTQTVFGVANLHMTDAAPANATKAGVLALIEG